MESNITRQSWLRKRVSIKNKIEKLELYYFPKYTIYIGWRRK